MNGIQDCDISAMLQKDQISEEPLPYHQNLLPHLQANLSTLEPSDYDAPIELDDSAFHSYKVERPLLMIDIDDRDQLRKASFSEILLAGPDSMTNEKTQNTVYDQNSQEIKQESSEEQTPKVIDKGYDKNIVGYIGRKSINMMFAKYSKYISKKCKQYDINYRHFKKHYKSFEDKITGPQELTKVFKSEVEGETTKVMKKLFHYLFNKLLRKNYLIYSLKVGKMKQMEPYIRKKNTQLLYFADQAQML